MRCSNRTHAPVALAPILLLLSCCSGDDAPVRDAGTDAGQDAGRDSGPPRDGGRDARPDTGAEPDAGPLEWIAVDAAPDDCPVRMARNPEVAVPPLAFEACPQYPDGCRQVVVDWTVSEGPRFQVFAGHHDGTHGYVAFWRGNEGDESTWVIARDDGSIVAVFRVPKWVVDGPQRCLPWPMVLGEGRYALGMIRWATSDSVEDQTFMVGRLGAPADPPELLGVFPAAELGNGPLQRMIVTETHLAVEIVPPYEVYLLDGSGAIVSSTVDLPGTSHVRGAHGDAMFVHHYNGPDLSIRIGTDGSPTQPLLPLGDTDVTGFSTDGESMAWLALYGFDGVRAERIELWASPFATSSAGVTPLMLTSDDLGFGRVWTGAGRALVIGWNYTTETDRAILYAVDGTGVSFYDVPPSSELRNSSITYLCPEELAIAPRPLPPMGPFLEALTIQFVRYDALPTE